MQISVFDIETSVGTYNCPVQLSALIFPDEIAYAENRAEAVEVLILPDDEITPMAVAIHGMNESVLRDRGAVHIKQCAPTLASLMERMSQGLVIGYNHKSFDIRVMRETLQRHGYDMSQTCPNTLDVLALARRLVNVKESGNHKLDTIFVYLFPDRVEELHEKRAAHDAMVDCWLTKMILDALLKKHNGTLEIAQQILSKRVALETWPFGKYRGRAVPEVLKDSGYIRWCLDQPWIETEWPDLFHTITKSREKPAVSPKADLRGSGETENDLQY